MAGQEGVILVPFHSNPPPTNITWYLTDLDEPLYLNQTVGKYTSEGWMEYVGLCISTNRIFHYFHFQNRTVTRTTTSTASGFVASLRVDKLRSSDSGMQHTVFVANELGSSNYTFRIQEITSKF